jgi:hypothetical protein
MIGFCLNALLYDSVGLTKDEIGMFCAIFAASGMKQFLVGRASGWD